MIKQSLLWKLILLGIILGLIATIVITVWLLTSYFDDQRPTFSLAEIEHLIDAKIPSDAADVSHKSRRGRDYYFFLTFKAPASSASNFVQKFCNGVLHDGYDPYDAINVMEQTDNALVIDMGTYYYYSYSDNSSIDKSGNRCRVDKTGIYQVVVDKSRSQTYEVKLEVFAGCPGLSGTFPCYGIHKIKSTEQMP